MTAPAAHPPLPAFVQIEPVGRCNLRCTMCPVQFRPDATPHAVMEFDAYCRLLDQFPALRELHLQGLGEPLMHPRFFDLVREAAGRGIRVSTNTNLTLLTQWRAGEAVRCGLSEISVSIDAATAEMFESIRIGTRHARVLRNLERLMQARASAAAPAVRIVMVLMRRNLAEIEGMVALAARMGVDGLFVQRLCHDLRESTLPDVYAPVRDFVQEEALGEEDAAAVQAAYARARETAQRLGVRLRLPQPAPRSGPRGCDWPWRGAYISYAGDAMPCCMVATPDRAQLGNMIRDGVRAVWDGEAYARFRRGLEEGAPAEICRTCSLYRGTF